MSLVVIKYYVNPFPLLFTKKKLNAAYDDPPPPPQMNKPDILLGPVYACMYIHLCILQPNMKSQSSPLTEDSVRTILPSDHLPKPSCCLSDTSMVLHSADRQMDCRRVIDSLVSSGVYFPHTPPTVAGVFVVPIREWPSLKNRNSCLFGCQVDNGRSSFWRVQCTCQPLNIHVSFYGHPNGRVREGPLPSLTLVSQV